MQRDRTRPRETTAGTGVPTLIAEASIATNDVDELFSWAHGWDFEIFQLSPGPLGYRSRTVQLPGLRLNWECSAQRLRGRHRMRQDSLFVSLAIAAVRPPVWKGCAVAANQLLVFGADEHELVTPEGMRGLNIEVAPALLDAWGLQAPPGGLLDIAPAAMGRLLIACRRARDLIGEAAEPPTATAVHAAREHILGRLIEALLSGGGVAVAPVAVMSTSDARRFGLVKRAEAAALRSGPEFDVAELADELHTSRRTLHRAIKDWSGIGPQAYFQILRLHRFRRRLLLGRSDEPITAVAYSLGFENMGRLAQLYRRFFGELPSQTRGHVKQLIR
ncbi:AraC family transcriptional regulator [Thiocapsa bogorovii]|uniref:AraC family transcriptional regulator n=1 Tax=Thiocapsa bogorovii TaxID=521689 RepID=UPI001E36A1CA|nr:helix-turn-helix domain-containing protein [Thiocapsa bogorovii]UHD18621.1 helix-turn-helix domain-containing protein [Thiocapsa bogorovii]